MASPFANKHITRVLAVGGTVEDLTWLDGVDTWITGQNLYGNLVEWANPALGIIKNGSNEISKILTLGTTWLPRLGDLTPVSPTNTIYNATANNGKPAWVTTSSSYCYWGAARAGTLRTQLIRRKHHQGFTVVCVYKKTHAFVSSPFGLGQSGGIYLQNTAGTPGSCKFFVSPLAVGGTSFSDTHPTTLANSTVNIIGGTFDQNTVISYVEGVPGTGSSGYISTNASASRREYHPLLGSANLVNQSYYNMAYGTNEFISVVSSTTTDVTWGGSNNQADMSVSELIIFDTALTPIQMASLNTFLRTRY